MDSGDKIRELINLANDPPKLFTARNLRLDVPVPDAGDGWNTKMEVEGIPGRGYYGTEEIFYKRIPLDLVNRTTPLRSIAPLTPQLVLDLFNGATGLFVTLEDVEPFTPPQLEDGDSGQVDIVAVPLSMGFTGTATILLEYGKAWLDTVVAVRILPVLKHPIVVLHRMSTRMLTWGMDFTSLRDAIRPDSKGDYSNWDALQAACVELNIPTWTQNKITDQPTSAVPDSNQLFDRVVIQASVSSEGMDGKVYLHYNNLEEV